MNEDTGTGSSSTIPATTTAQQRRLVRRSEGKVVAGVCSGLGAYTGVDPVAWRIGFVVLTLVTGVGLVAYLIAWLVTPMDDGSDPAPVVPSDPMRVRRWVGIGAILLGAILLLNRIWDLQGGFLWGLLLIGVGIALWGRDLTGEQTEPRPDAPPPSTPPPPTPEDTPRDGDDDPKPPVPPVPPAPPDPPQTRPEPSGPHGRGSSVLGRVVVGAAALAVGIALLLDNLGVVGVTPIGMIITLLAIVGAGLLVGTWWGRARWLVAPGIVLSLVLVAVAIVPSGFGGGMGQTRWSPTTLSQLQRSYTWTAGEVLLDLSELNLAGRSRDVRIDVGFGEVLVVVPDDATVVVDGRIQAGQLYLFDEIVDSGWGVADTARLNGSPDGGRLDIEADLGFGELRFRERTADDALGIVDDDEGIEVDVGPGTLDIRVPDRPDREDRR